MANKEIIEKVKTGLQKGDYLLIATSTGVNISTVNNLFNGREGSILEDMRARIIDAALVLIDQRIKRDKAIKKKTTLLLGQ